MPEHDEVHVRRVPAGTGRCRLDVFLAGQPEVSGRSQARRLIEGGCVLVDERAAKPSTSLRDGQLVSFRLLEEDGGAEDLYAGLRLCVLYEDPYVLVIDKQPGLASHPPESPGHRVPDVSTLARTHCSELSEVAGAGRAGIVHRLDRNTSGVMVLAKTDEACHFLKAQFKARSVFKEYRAIAYGEARFDSDHIERNIAVNPRPGDRMTTVTEGGKPASTFYEVVRRFRGFTHFRCLPKTGRTHQIRVHLASIGHSLVGDRTYRSRNSARSLPEGAPDPGRHCLHALRLGFKHPLTREDLVFDAPILDDMQKLLDWLENERPA